jgi:L-ascorbate metabolism protein UlaG (beta-lactamase superfamily)
MAEKGKVTIKWLGHSSFLISLDEGIRIVTDPFDESVGYPMPNETADLCVVSHDHFDHNCVSAVKGNPQVVKGHGEKQVKDLNFKGISSFHDESKGSQRGENTIWAFELGVIRLVHLGDLGIDLTDEQVKEIGQPDILFVPTGGFYTIDANTAGKLVTKLNPKAVIPMHYKMPFMGDNFPLSGVDAFTRGKKDVVKVGKNSISFTRESLPDKTTIYVLEHGK